MITRDESHNLPDCLASVKDIVDQIVVVDTGSTDNTIDIARSFKAEVFHFDWIDDFSKARNYSIQQARGDWILWLDADERLLPASINVVRGLLKREAKPVIYKTHIRNRMSSGNYEYWSTAHRLFNNRRGIKFSGSIHEQVSPSVAALKGEERDSEIQIDHLGYGLSESEMTAKFSRNEKLLVKLVTAEPDNAYAHYTLAQNYGLQNDPGKALGCYQKALDLNQLNQSMTAAMFNSMGDIFRQMGAMDQVRESAQKSLELIPGQVAAHFLLYKVAESKNDYPAMVNRLELIKTINREYASKPKQLSTDVQLNDSIILSTLYQTLFKAGNHNQAREYLKELLALPEANNEKLEQLANIATGFNDLESVCLVYDCLLMINPDNQGYADKLGIVNIKLKNFDWAIEIYESLVARDKTNKALVKRLAGLYGIVGKQAEAVKILSTIGSQFSTN